MPETCFHCGLPVPAGTDFAATIDQTARPMCCRGCQAVAEAIVEAGMADYYRFRTHMPAKGEALIPDELQRLQAYDHPRVQERFADVASDSEREASLILEGITCAACVWLNERHIAALPGVREVAVNYATQRARVRWDPQRIQLSEILAAIARIGYRAHPYDPARRDELLERERKGYLRRLGVTAVLGMQIMVLSVALYAGGWWGMEPDIATFLRQVSLLLAVPILVYGARPFFAGAWRDARRGRAGMDVPVALGMGIAFTAGVFAVVRNQGEVYFDSVAMFTFFLLTARFLELSARRKAARATDALARLQPAIARLLNARADGFEEQTVASADLTPGNRILVRPGESVPADGLIETGRSSLDESLLTGESLPVHRGPGDTVIGGSVNVESPLQIRVERVDSDTVLSSILDLLERAQTQKTAVAKLADRVAARFVPAILLLAGAVAGYWYLNGSDDWLPITIALLVVTCPCALSLATPAALTAATGRLARLGLITTRGHALETLSRATDIVFDKTGTLTEGRPELLAYRSASNLPRARALAVAAALERHSEHPLAKALTEAGETEERLHAQDVENHPGEGLQGRINGQRWRIGTWAFVAASSERGAYPPGMEDLERQGQPLVFLSNEAGDQGVFLLGDRLRPGAAATLRALRALGLRTHLFTGDRRAAAERVADELGIESPRWGMRPQDKLDHVRAMERQGARVAMIGDGVNDAPVLAGAAASVAMGDRTRLAAASADMVLLNEHLPHLAEGIGVARRTLKIIRQNLLWALGYNLAAIPAAAMGLVQPWMAAIGMSLSSLIVVLNALRLVK